MAAPGRTDPWALPEDAPTSGAGTALLVGGVGLLASIGTAARFLDAPSSLAGRAVLVGLLAVTALVALLDRRVGTAVGAGLAAAALAASTPAEGRSAIGVVLIGAAIGALAIAPGTGRRVGERPATLGLGLVLAAQVAWFRGSTTLTLALLALAAGAVALHRLRPTATGAAERGLGVAVNAVVRAIAVVVTLIAAVPTLYLPGAVANLIGRLRRRSAPASTWHARSASPAELRRDERELFATPAVADRRRRQRIGLALLVLLVPVVLVARARSSTPQVAANAIVFPDFAYPDEPWVDELYAAGFNVDFHPSLGWKSSEVTSRYLNVSDSVRRSWAGDEPRFTVWFLGGSALWGLGQRDDHTIPSEISRLADAAGLPIEAVNLGVPGYSQWQQVAVIGLRLSRGERPDLIVSYDGANDLTGMIYRASQGIEPLDEPPNRFHEQVEVVSRFAPERRGEKASDEELLAAFRRVYGDGVELATEIAGAYGVPIAFYFQPQYLSTAPSPADAPLLRQVPWLAPPDGDWERELIARAREDLPSAVIDLSEALDDAGTPTWFDPVHTNELGARLVAEEMWQTLDADLRALPAD